MTLPFAKPRRLPASLKPFDLHIKDELLKELQDLIKHSVVGPPTYESLQEDGKYGLTHKWLVEAKARWQTFDWRKQEAKINSFPHFMAEIAYKGHLQTIHFCGFFSERADAIPVLLLHGWPGSFLEFLPMLDLLRTTHTPESLPYHVIVPSLPGYGLSSGPSTDTDFTLADAAKILDQLMQQLGMGSGYIVQGGDVGSKVARILAKTSDSCKAIHLNFCSMQPPKDDSLEISEQERKGLLRARQFEETGRGYAIEHATRPSTISFVLSSNPIALLAWVGEKFLEWSGEDIAIEDILESASLYWLTGTIATSIYTYRAKTQADNAGGHGDPRWNISKPLGYSYFPNEVAPTPISWVATTGQLVFSRSHSRGGHFAALEAPGLLLKDIEDFIAIAWPKINVDA